MKKFRFGYHNQLKRLVLLLFAFTIPLTIPSVADEDPAVNRGPNMVVDSQDLESFAIEEDEEDRLVFYEDEKMVVGFNEDSEPSVGMPF